MFKPKPAITLSAAAPAHGWTFAQYEATGDYQIARDIANELMDARTLDDVTTLAMRRAADLERLKAQARPLAAILSGAFKDRRAQLARGGR